MAVENGTSEEPTVLELALSDELERAYADYARYVISDRALPDARDGLKPVHRRILWAMFTMGLTPRGSFKKCARIVGEATGKYHPHAGGVYESLVRLAQPFSLRYPLVQGQGNFGSIDGFPAAAMRYTEARLAKVSMDLLEGTREEIVPFIDNFDGEEREPTVIATKIPNLLINGTSGIAVGMSSNIPPHNLSEVIDAAVHLLDYPFADGDELLRYVSGPDFPTGATIIGTDGIKDLYRRGRGKIVVRSKYHFEPKEGRKESMIVIDEIPYLINKAKLVAKIHDHVTTGRLEGVREVRDLSKHVIRIELALNEAFTDEYSRNSILKQLFSSTSVQQSFHARNLAFVDGQPLVLTLKGLLLAFLQHREVVVRKRTLYELGIIKLRLEIVEGLIIASDHIDEIIRMIRASDSRAHAHEQLKDGYALSDRQSKAVLDMPLARLAKLEQQELRKEAKELIIERDRLQGILDDRNKLIAVIREELLEVKKKHGDARRTNIQRHDEFSGKKLRPLEKQVVLTVTHKNYVRSLAYSSFKTQGRGGKGVIGLRFKEADFLTDMLVTSNLSSLLLLTEEGKIHELNAYRIPTSARRTAMGMLVDRILPVESRVAKIVSVRPDLYERDDYYLVTLTQRGIIKKTKLNAYSQIRRSGIICVKLATGDRIADAFLAKDEDEFFVATKKGQMARFVTRSVRDTGRSTQGVIGVRLQKGDSVVCGFALPAFAVDNMSALVVTEKGYGKRSRLSLYRLTGRSVKGVRNIKITDKNGDVASVIAVPSEPHEDESVSLINSNGTLIKVPVNAIREMGRSTQGVRMMRLSPDERVTCVSTVIDDSVSDVLMDMDAQPSY